MRGRRLATAVRGSLLSIEIGSSPDHNTLKRDTETGRKFRVEVMYAKKHSLSIT